jgi:hypothetical protein
MNFSVLSRNFYTCFANISAFSARSAVNHFTSAPEKTGAVLADNFPGGRPQ